MAKVTNNKKAVKVKTTLKKRLKEGTKTEEGERRTGRKMRRKYERLTGDSCVLTWRYPN
jgi:hypothetical protein